jgi:hypothetical protein
MSGKKERYSDYRIVKAQIPLMTMVFERLQLVAQASRQAKSMRFVSKTVQD